MTRILLLSFATLAGGCTLPTTVGFRSAGDPDLAGRGAVGASVGGVVGTVNAVTVSADGSYGLTDHVGVGGGIGLFGGLFQGQGDVRISTDREGAVGGSALVGLGVSTGIGSVVVGPYGGATGRVKLGDVGFVYGGAKINPVFGAASSSWWLIPAVGFSSAPRPFRGGVELYGMAPFAGTTLFAASVGLQGWVSMSLPSED